jgi:hypothetical protein
MNADPGTLVQLYDFIRTGHGTMAAGLVLTLLVAAIRHGLLAQFAWTKEWAASKLGGYILGFGTSIAAYLATALLAGQAFTVQLFLNALGAGWVAAGGWEHLQDVLGLIKPPSALKPATVSIVVVLACVLGLSSGCTKNTRIETLQVTKLGLDAAKEGFDVWNAQHEMDVADDPKLTSKDAYTAAITAYRIARKKVIDGFILAYQLYSTATTQNDSPSLSAVLGEATTLYNDVKQLEGDIKGGK